MRLLGTAAAAAALGVSVRRVRQLIDEEKLTAQKVGRDYAIEESALAGVRVYGKPGRPPKWATAAPKNTNNVRRAAKTAQKPNQSFKKIGEGAQKSSRKKGEKR